MLALGSGTRPVHKRRCDRVAVLDGRVPTSVSALLLGQCTVVDALEIRESKDVEDFVRGGREIELGEPEPHLPRQITYQDIVAAAEAVGHDVRVAEALADERAQLDGIILGSPTEPGDQHALQRRLS